MFKMKDEYKTGIDFIDEQHAMIFDIADRTYYLLKNEFVVDKFDKIVELIDELKEYSAFHFRAEEAYMQKIGHKKMFTQKIEHDKFIKMMEDIEFGNIDENQDKYISDILMFLNDWLVHHILERDVLIENK